jgi:hypothetical protein
LTAFLLDASSRCTKPVGRTFALYLVTKHILGRIATTQLRIFGPWEKQGSWDGVSKLRSSQVGFSDLAKSRDRPEPNLKRIEELQQTNVSHGMQSMVILDCRHPTSRYREMDGWSREWYSPTSAGLRPIGTPRRYFWSLALDNHREWRNRDSTSPPLKDAKQKHNSVAVKQHHLRPSLPSNSSNVSPLNSGLSLSAVSSCN